MRRAQPFVLWPLIIAAAMAGCERAGATPDGETTYNPHIYRYRNTGCEYLSAGGRSITPRIAADGKTHLGCKGVQQ
jgi:hypothetical protein